MRHMLYKILHNPQWESIIIFIDLKTGVALAYCPHSKFYQDKFNKQMLNIFVSDICFFFYFHTGSIICLGL